MRCAEADHREVISTNVGSPAVWVKEAKHLKSQACAPSLSFLGVLGTRQGQDCVSDLLRLHSQRVDVPDNGPGTANTPASKVTRTPVKCGLKGDGAVR